MLAWTPAGAVARPRTLQLRLAPAHPERVAGLAPTPSRALTPEEAVANLDWFTTPGPRGLPVDGLVLSGSGVAARPDLPALIARARRAGVTRVVAHTTLAEANAPLDVERRVLTVVATADTLAQLRAVLGTSPGLDLNAPILAHTLPGLSELASLAGEGAGSLTFTWPFPGGGEPPSLPDTLDALRAAIPHAGTVPITIKGIPACWLGELAGYTRRSVNRWYVDAEHQKDAAILFFPGVVAFAKADPCRF